MLCHSSLARFEVALYVMVNHPFQTEGNGLSFGKKEKRKRETYTGHTLVSDELKYNVYLSHLTQVTFPKESTTLASHTRTPASVPLPASREIKSNTTVKSKT